MYKNIQTPKGPLASYGCYYLEHYKLIASFSLITNDRLNVIMKDSNEPNPSVWAIGDAAMIEDAPLPATAQGK